MLEGLLKLSTWEIVVVTLVMTHITIASVTIFLHRHQAHKALTLHPIASHFFRFWLWLTTGMVTREWVAVHRKHHAKCETEDDPHSPKVKGIFTVLFAGVGLYRAAASNAEVLQHYGSGTPDDWLEHHIYSRYPFLGILIMAALDLVLFGAVGIIVFATQMVWIPFWAAGVVNGVGHFWGYRNFETTDASRNLSPIGIIIGGEELHNNHHAYPQSARLSNKWWELDIGWFYIKFLAMLRLARIRRISPKIRITHSTQAINLNTLRAVVQDRYHILTLYGRKVIGPVVLSERRMNRGGARRLLQKARKLMTREDITLDAPALATLNEVLSRSQTLETVYRFKAQLKAVWTRTTNDGSMRLERLEQWCIEAERSGIKALEEFAYVLRGYALPTP